MNYISQSDKSTLQILNKVRKNGPNNRFSQYCIVTPAIDGHLLFNLLTRELILLSEEEWQNRFDNEYLKSHWFVVPQDCKDKEYADLVRWVLQNKQKEN